ncbi:PriCT-2 domain-containing protein [Kingella kingae]|uniref:MuF-C-terminal domain-containing protein n=1 Tax=Kingella kingae TaxID=504 RepID=UPI00068AC3DA|nr:LPD7 domain-containing protein [Kingella kingae]MDK4525607.1 PriCT-2 domain-containing protein [Kingella kingae]MDK4532685.1 PriCT-2 domain-containing protein [Kingella kingae]CRZ20123.1 Toprim domain protein [Kingella kingae]
MTTTYETDYDEVRNALTYLDPNDRETWWKVGAALKSEFDEGGRSLWEDWSRSYPKWNERESNAQWKSFKYGHIHIGTLFHMAKANGFTFSQSYRAPSVEEIAHREAAWAVKREVQDAWDKVSRDHAARTANIVWENANTRPADAGFPYLSDKGITDPAVLANARINRFKDEDRLVIPMYDRPNHIVNRQAIDANGGKFFLPGGEVGGAYGKIAAPNSDWTGGVYLAEGFATAASIHMATGKPVVIAFNAGNLPKVAAKMAQILPKNAPVYIAADNDASQTGIKKAAEAAQVLGNRARVVMPEFTGDEIARFQAKHGQDSLPSDYNDLHELRGLEAVKAALDTPLAPETLPETAVRHEEVREHNNAQAIAGLEPAEAQQLFEAELGKINNVKIRDSVKRELASRDVGFRLPERQKQPAPAQTALSGPSQGLNEGPDTPFTRAVDDVVSGNVSAGYIALGTTPDVLQMLGVPQGKVRISGGTIEKAMAKYIGRSHNYDQNDHWVRPGDLKQLQSQMNDPIAIFQSATNAHSLVVLTELYEYEDNKEKPMIAALHINKGKGKHGADLINVSSVYGRSDMQLVRAFDTDLLYANEKKVQDFLTTHPLQLHWDITSSSELSMRNIKTEMDLVQWQNAQKQPIQPNPQQSVPREPVRRDGLGQLAPEKSAAHSERAPWNDFPPLIRNGTLEELKNSENYQAAKAGDSKAALSLVQSLLNEQTIAEIQEMAGGREPVIVAVRAEESAGRNKIPFMMARALSSQTGWQVDTKLFQANFAGRTGTDAVYRLANPPIFRGDVQAGRDYLIVDDNSTMGGTIASLRGYIENRGGHVIGAAVMSARETGLDIVPTQKQLDDIQRKHGDAPNDYWTNTFGYGIDHLTRGEAGTIRTSPSFDRLRSGIDAARLQRSERMGDRGIAQKSVDTAQSPEPKHLNRNPRTADDKPLSAVSFAQKENIMTDLSPEQIRSYAQRIANITDEADRNAAIDEFAENHGTNIRRQVGEILQEREARVVSGQNENLTGTQPDTTHTAAEQAAVSVSATDKTTPVEKHYSEQIIDQLTEQHGWKKQDALTAQKTFQGIGEGGMLNPDGNHVMYARFNETGRYLALESGWDTVFEIDARDIAPPAAAEVFDRYAGQYAHQNTVPSWDEMFRELHDSSNLYWERQEAEQILPQQPDNPNMEQQLKTELENVALPENMYFETETLSNGRAIARIQIQGYDNEIMLDKLEQGGYIATFNDFHLEFNQLSALREMTSRLEREYMENQAMRETAENRSQTAAEQAAVSVSGSPEPQAAKDQIADTQPESAAETAPDEENGIEFDGEAQDLEQEAPEAESTFRQPENPAPERETITAEEVRQNLARARTAEALQRQDGQKQPVLERQPETVPPQQEARPQGTPEADLGSLFDEAVPQSAREPAPSENPAIPQKPKPVLDLDYETASGLNQRYIRMEGKYLDLNNRTTVMFEDQGGKIKTAAADPQVIRDMLDTAQAKNWGSIKISGSREFKQAMWLEAELRGIPSTGYKPGREDLALRDQLLAERQRNGIEETQLQQAKQPENSSVQSSSAEPHSQDRKAQAAESQKGVMLLEHGAAPYLHNPDNPTNYFVKYEQDGEIRERWGVELESALTESGAQAGDRIEIHDLGRQPVVVNILVRDESGKIVRDEQGNKVFEEKEVEKNLFRIEVLERQQDRQPETARVRQNSPLPDQSAVVHSEAAQAAAKADTSKEKVLAAEIQHRAAQFANGQQNSTGQTMVTPNHALESARALYQQQLGKSRKEVKATVQYLENIQRKMTETLEPALRDRQMQRFYESVTADMKSGSIPTPKRTAGQNQTHRNETRHPAHEQENEQEM